MNRFMEISAKIGSQKHLVAVRDAFIALMPLTMAGSVAVLINVFFRDIPTELGNTGFVESMQWLIGINGNVWFATLAIMAMVFAFTLGYNVSRAYNVNPLAGGLVSFASLIATVPQSATFFAGFEGVATEQLSTLTGLGVNAVVNEAAVGIEANSWGFINVNYLGSNGIFTALIIGMLSSIIYAKLMQRGLVIKLPDSVPPAVSRAFEAIIPGIIVIYLVATISYLSVTFLGSPINDFILKYVQMPLLGLSQGFFSVLLMSFLVQLFWFFGLHGHNVLGPIMDGIYMPALLENTNNYQMYHDITKLPYLWTRGSFDAYAQMGGSGVTIALIIAIFILSKREDHRAVAKLAAPMGIFNINEPITFGMPIVLNPTFIIPWLIVPPICAGVAYAFTAAGIIPPVFVSVPWITPPGLYAYLATGGNILAGLVSLLNVGIAFAIWAPFVIMANKQKPNEE